MAHLDEAREQLVGIRFCLRVLIRPQALGVHAAPSSIDPIDRPSCV